MGLHSSVATDDFLQMTLITYAILITHICINWTLEVSSVRQITTNYFLFYQIHYELLNHKVGGNKFHFFWRKRVLFHLTSVTNEV